MRIKIITFAVAVILGCKRERLPTEWSGIDGANAACSWSEIGRRNDVTGTCIVGGRAFTCIMYLRTHHADESDVERSLVVCAPAVGQPDAEKMTR